MTNPDESDRIDQRNADDVIASELTRDLELATETDLPVLISGSPSASRAFARELYRKCRAPKGSVEVVDCREGAALSTLHDLMRPADGVADARARARILLLEEVHALGPTDQALLEQEIEDMRTRPACPVRILASSSAPLFDRVVDQLFSERLFYRLNLIHVVVPAGHRFAGESAVSASN